MPKLSAKQRANVEKLKQTHDQKYILPIKKHSIAEVERFLDSYYLGLLNLDRRSCLRGYDTGRLEMDEVNAS